MIQAFTFRGHLSIRGGEGSRRPTGRITRGGEGARRPTGRVMRGREYR